MRKRTGAGATLFAATMALVAAALVGGAGAAGAATSPGNTHFPRYKELEPNVAFWSDVFTRWTSKQIAFHDVEHLDLVYSVISVQDIVTRLPDSQQDDAIAARRKAEGERISNLLREISDGQARTEEERRILKAIAKIGQEPAYALTLADQVRSQRGLGDRFCEAAARAEAYRPMMSQVLEQYDVPQELLALPLVESGYKIGARSSAGAAGIWQFMPATGRLYLEINAAYDDRRDPRRSTEAAARMLRKTYETLGSWPLAITSYNHGPGGIARAVKDMGTTHFGVISKHYKGKAFGFASRNYYAEFLAAADAMKRVDQLCGDITVQTYAPDEVVLGASASIRDLARAARTSVENIDDLNPALSDACERGSLKVPRGYRLNLPRGTRNDFEVAFGHVDRSAPSAPTLLAKADDDDRVKAPSSGRLAATVLKRDGDDEDEVASTAGEPAQRYHLIAKGETLGQIARRYGTTETTLLYLNRLRNSQSAKAGTTILVPADRATAPATVAQLPERPPFSKTMTTNAGIVAAKEAGQAAAAAALAAQTAVAAVPAAVIQKQDVTEASAKPGPKGQEKTVPPAVIAKDKAASDAGDAKAADAVADAKPADSDADPVLTAEHKVARGQTLTQIASMYHTSVDELMKMNGLDDASQVQAGQTLKVRTSGSELVSVATVGRTYKVRPGDTMWSVARANDTSVETLKRLNPKLSSGLRSGDTIKVPSAGAVASAARVDADDSPAKPAAKASAAKSATASASGKVAKTASKPAAKTTAKAAKPASKTTAKASSKAAKPEKVAKSSFRSHKVQKGQTLSTIAAKYGTSVDTLKKVNGIRDARSVQVGKTLKVPL